MAKRAPRSLQVETLVTLDDIDYEVSASFSRGSSDYFSASFGNWLPGDPDELEDITVKNSEGIEVDFDSLPLDTRTYIEEQLMLAVEDEAVSRQSDDDDRRCDADRDDRRLGCIFRRHQQRFQASVFGGRHGRLQRSLDRPHRAVHRQFADDGILPQQVARNLPGGR